MKKELKNGRVFWSCSKKGCYASVRTLNWSNNTVVKMSGEHSETCKVSECKIAADGLTWDMKTKRKETGCSTLSIIGQMTMHQPLEVMAAMPKRASLAKSFQRISGSSQKTSDVFNYTIPEELKSFLWWDHKYEEFNNKTRVVEKKRILGFADTTALDIGQDAIFGDGTFKSSPPGFLQLYTFHTKVGGRYVLFFK